MGLKATLHGHKQMELDFISTVYHILKRHSGTGLKTFGLEMSGYMFSLTTHVILIAGFTLLFHMGLKNSSLSCA
jgi:hypothetical protein